MPIPSLAQLARRACIKNVNFITDVGDAEYDLIRPVLLRVQNPKQLYELEQNSPQIIGVDAEIWKQFCKRDVPNYEKNPQEPANPKSWYKCYQKLYRAGQNEIDADTAALKATMDEIKNNKAKNTAQQVELRGVKVPNDLKKNIPIISLPKGSGVYRAMRHRGEYSHSPAVKGPPKVLSTLAKIRKETAAQSHFTAAKQLQRGITSTKGVRTPALPTKTTIVKAPRSFIEAHQKAKIAEPLDPTIKPAPVFNPKKRRIEHVETTDQDSSAREAREKRLKALTQQSGARSAPSIIRPTSNVAPTPRETPKADLSHRKELAKTDNPRPPPSQSRSSANNLTPNRPNQATAIRPGSPTAWTKSSTPQNQSPVRIHRAPDNPLMAPKSRPVQRT